MSATNYSKEAPAEGALLRGFLLSVLQRHHDRLVHVETAETGVLLDRMKTVEYQLNKLLAAHKALAAKVEEMAQPLPLPMAQGQ